MSGNVALTMVVRILVYFVKFRLWDYCLLLLVIIVFCYWLWCSIVDVDVCFGDDIIRIGWL